MSLKAIRGFVAVSIKSFFKDRGSVFWVIVWPVMLVLLSAYVFIPPSAGSPMTLDLGIVNHDEGTAPFNGTTLIDMLRHAEYNGTKLFNVKVYESEEQLLRDLDKGRLDAGLVVPSGFGAAAVRGTASLTVYVSGSSVYSIQVNRGIMSSFLCEFSRRLGIRKAEAALRFVNKSMPVSLPAENTTLGEFLHRYLTGIAEPINATMVERAPEALSKRPQILGWYVIGAVGMMMLYTGFSIGATAIVEEKEKGRLERILSTPATHLDLLAGKMLAGFVILLLSSLVVVLVGLGVGAEIEWSPTRPVDLLVPLHFVLLAIMTISIGFLLSLASNSSKGAGSIAVVLGLVLSFTAGIWFPREWMPAVLRALADVFPATWSLDAVRSIVVYRAGLGEALLPTIKSAVASLAIFTVGLEAYRRTVRRYVEV